jgi:ferredoxin-nitrite reductase
VLDTPVNIHLTGCPNSCAQHYMGDVGMIGTKVVVNEGADDEAEVEGYHVFVGGGYGADQRIGRELYRSVVATDLPRVIEQMLRGYVAGRRDAGETFNEFVRRHEADALRAAFAAQAEASSDDPRTVDPAEAASAAPLRRLNDPMTHADSWQG